MVLHIGTDCKLRGLVSGKLHAILQVGYLSLAAHHNNRLHVGKLSGQESVSNHNRNTKWNKVALTATAWTAQTCLTHWLKSGNKRQEQANQQGDLYKLRAYYSSRYPSDIT